MAEGLFEPDAMALATASPDGMPSVRIVLLKGIDDRGLRFFTNYGSRKGRELDANPRAAVTIHWATMHRAVRAEGAVERLTAEESDAYFASRGRGSRLGAWASRQGTPIPSRDARGRVRRRRRPLPGRGRAAAGATGRLPARARRGRALAGPPNRLHDREHFLRARGRELAVGAAVAVSWLGGPLDVDGLAVDAVRSALEAAAELAEARGLGRPAVSLSEEHVAVSFTSERHARVRGEPAGAGFAPLSRMVRCRDGWARTHANYPHHEAALRRALGIGADVGELEAAAAAMRAVELEDAIVAAGGCAAALRTEAEWAAHPAGAALAGTSLAAGRARRPRPVAMLPRARPRHPGRRRAPSRPTPPARARPPGCACSTSRA